jgi:hypothetical protein
VTDTPPPPQDPSPPQQPWQQPAYGAPQQWGAHQPMGVQQQWGAPPFTPPKKTNGLAITSLVCGLGWIVVGPLAVFTGIAAVITGHIARKQIRARDENGAGMALAGLILGYISIVFSIIAAIGIAVFVFAVIPNIIEDEVQDDARDFGRAVVTASIAEDTSPRTVELLHEVYRRETYYSYNSGSSSGCCDDDVIRLPDGTPFELAVKTDFERNNWQVEFEQTFIGDKVACLTIPETTSDAIIVTEGVCSG